MIVHVCCRDGTCGGTLAYFKTWDHDPREVQAHTAYHWVYRESVKPWLVADLLILNKQMPRSLACCYESLVRHLDLMSDLYGRRGPAQRHASDCAARLSAIRIEEVFGRGLHEWVTEFIIDNNKLGSAIADQYLT